MTRTLLIASGAAVALVIAGLAPDISGFDRTRGGYEAPYTDFTGEPIDWSRTETTAHGMRKRGYVLDVTVDCTSGMIRFERAGPSASRSASSRRAPSPSTSPARPASSAASPRPSERGQPSCAPAATHF